MGIKMNQQKTVEVEAKEIRLYCKVRDMFTAHIHDQDGNEIGGQDDGYVADFFPEDHYGDYLILNIDLETGQITNWVKPDANDIEKFLEREDD
jgi:hypothetical protein